MAKPWTARPEDDVLRDLLETHSHSQIATRFGVKRQTVGYWAKKIGKGRPAAGMNHKDVLPWDVRAEDHHDSIARALRWWNKQRHGETLTPAQQGAVTSLTDYLSEKGVVVDYDREKGFIFRKRLPSDDPDGLIRRPAE